MNLKEGLWRLALVGGTVGALGGFYVSVMMAGDILRERREYSNFKALLDTPAAREDITMLEGSHTTPPGYGMISVELPPGPKNPKNIKKLDYGTSEDGVHMRIDLIELRDGTLVYHANKPNIGVELLCLTSPIIGFLVPWIVLMVIRWVVAGFSSPFTGV